MKAKQTASLSATARSAIVAAYVEALTTNESTGSLVTQVCDAANKYMHGEPIATGDRTAIAADIAKARGWKGTSLKSRISEVNVVLRAYDRLPEAIEGFTQRAKRCQWHDSMKIARRLNKGDSVAKAIKAALLKDKGAKVSPAGRAAGALKAWFKVAPRKQKAIVEAAELLGLKLGVKLNA